MYSPYQQRSIGTEKMEEELAVHIRKALSTEESAPKQKHVRACIVYTWEVKGSGSFWRAIKSFPSLGDEIVTFKLLITTHKVIRQGHPDVLKDGTRERSFINSLTRNTGNAFYGGYGDLIRAYVKFLDGKLDYHATHPEFSGNFDYEDYVSLKGIADPNEGYHTIEELLDMLGKIDTLQKLVFQNLRPTGNNEARIAALVPLVEESYGIYQFIESMMTAMHQVIGSAEVLSPLRNEFKKSHYALLKFYEDCKSLRYLTSLITIPNLPQDPPDFLSKPPTRKPKNVSLEKEQNDDEDRFLQEQERLHQQFLREQELQRQREAELKRQRDLELQQQRELEMQRQREQELKRQEELKREAELARKRLEEEHMRMMQQQQAANAHYEMQLYQNKLLESQNLIDQLRNQSNQDKNTIDQYATRMKVLEDQLALLNLKNDEETIRKLSGILCKMMKTLTRIDEVNIWKQKYEALAKLYAQLRKEHLELLTKFKELKDAGSNVADQAKLEIERAKLEVKSKANEMTEVLIERDRLKNELDRLKAQHGDDLSLLRQQLRDAQDSLSELSTSKGAEVNAMLSRFNLEKNQLESQLKAKKDALESLQRQLDKATDDARKAAQAYKEETDVLKAGLDRTLLALDQQQKNSESSKQDVSSKLDKLRKEHLDELYRMLDGILIGSAETIKEAIFQLDSPAYTGNQGASPEFVLSVLEKAVASVSDFSTSMVKLSQGSDPKEAIAPTSHFAQAMIQLCHNVKGVNRLAGDDALAEKILETVKASALASKSLLLKTQSTELLPVPKSVRPDIIVKLCQETQEPLAHLGSLVSKLVAKDISSLNLESDLGDVVEREMRNAAKAIEDAALRLQTLMSQTIQGPNLNVHSAILEATMAITNAIANLIRCATATEQEIVAQGKGSASKGAFYKKNNKWTEGLISAAKSVAIATTHLVECADGLIHGTHSWEELVVAAQEVSIATTQLVAASRVKTVAFSKTQDKLEAAAVAVRDATNLLVKAAKEASKQSAEQGVMNELSAMRPQEFKIQENNQKVLILKLEKELETARYKLGQIRKQGYSE